MKRPEYHKGRGALSNPDNRFDHHQVEDFDDGWWRDEEINGMSSIPTTVLQDKSRTIISTNDSPDLHFDQSINPYRGCEHGCIYCYARPSHAYWGYSPGLDFETRILVKPNAPELLRQAFDKPRYRCRLISIGANTDPYQPVERELEVTRGLLEVMQEYRHPFSLITKSALILRDLDIIGPMAERGLCSVAVSVTTLDDELKRKLEPRTASPAARLRTIRTLAGAGIPVTIMVAPVIPMINDEEIEKILEAGRDAGATSSHYIFLRLPNEISQMFREWLREHYPDRAEHVMNLIRQSRGGRDNQSRFFTRFTGDGVFADLIRKRFQLAARKLGYDREHRFSLDTSQFKRPEAQFSLFGDRQD